jgi:hypothetical protein
LKDTVGLAEEEVGERNSTIVLAVKANDRALVEEGLFGVVTMEDISADRDCVIADGLGEGFGKAVVSALRVVRITRERTETGGGSVGAVVASRKNIEILKVAGIGRVGYIDELRET